jgi:hypothetical protein
MRNQLSSKASKVLILLAFLFSGISKKHKENQYSGEQFGEQILTSNLVHRISLKTAPAFCFSDRHLLSFLSFWPVY